MSSKNYSELLRTLNPNEKSVMYMTKLGIPDEDIGRRFDRSKVWVQLQRSNAHRKLEFPESMHWARRKEILERDVYRLIPKSLDDWLEEGLEEEEEIEEIKEEIKEEVKAEEPPEEEPEVVTGDVIEEHPLSAPPETSDRRPLLVFAILLGLCILGVWGFRAYQNRPIPTAVIVPTVVFTDVPATSLPLPTATTVSTPTYAATETQTSTVVPPSPTATVFVPPADGILYQDNFDNGISPGWVYSANWITANGKLTLINSGGAYEWIRIEEPWRNYIVTVDVSFPESNALGNAVVFARGLGASIRTTWDVFFTSGDRIPLTESYDIPYKFNYVVEVTVSGDNYTLRVDGTEYQTINTQFGGDTGGISLGVSCNTEIVPCPSFDNLKVTYLP